MKRSVVLFWFLIAMFLAVTVIAENGYAGNWTKKSVSRDANYQSIVLDKNGNAHVFYVHVQDDPIESILQFNMHSQHG